MREASAWYMYAAYAVAATAYLLYAVSLWVRRRSIARLEREE